MFEEINNLIKKQIRNGIYPCANWAFLQDGKVERYLEGFAQIKPEKEYLRENMLFDMASVTKVVCTGTVVLKLWEDGKLDLEKPFRVYYPSFQDEKVTLRHLLTHTSDIDSYIENRDRLNAKELRKAYNYLKSGENIGKIFKYTDTGTVLMGFMLEEIFGKSAQAVFQEQVLTPLQMDDSGFQPIEPKSLAVPTELSKKRGLIRGETHDPKAYVLGKHAGSAGLFSTLNDQINFTKKMFFEQSYLKSETIDSLLKDWAKVFKRSLGWDLKEDKKGHLYLLHTGFTGTFLLANPKNKRAFIFLSNRVHPENHRLEYLSARDELLKLYLEME